MLRSRKLKDKTSRIMRTRMKEMKKRNNLLSTRDDLGRTTRRKNGLRITMNTSSLKLLLKASTLLGRI